jgi:cytosine/adenosine deaminase-related metal-dependent hydrolase
MSENNSSRFTARWVFPVDGPPIEHGVIEVVDGVISDVRPSRGPADSGGVDLGNVAILPGLINAHAHLEFSDLDAPIQPPAPFTDWIRSLMAHRRTRTPSLPELIKSGLQLSLAWGTSTVGDIVTGDWTPDCVTPFGPRTIAFRELIGLRPEQAAEQLEIAKQHIALCRNSPLPVQPAISPHAPYSVGLDLFHRLIEVAEAEDVPVCLHLAETQAELELLSQGTGELVDMLSGFGIWQDGLFDRGLRPLDYLRPLANLNHAIIAHGNYLSQEEMEFLGRHSNVAVAFCPRTHGFFGHSGHPWQRLMEAGALVCLGTDGCSSNPDYSLWSEVTFLDGETQGRCRPQLLELATVNGARALGAGDMYGPLTPGRIADFCVVHLPDRDGTDPWGILFSPESRIGNATVVHDRRSCSARVS